MFRYENYSIISTFFYRVLGEVFFAQPTSIIYPSFITESSCITYRILYEPIIICDERTYDYTKCIMDVKWIIPNGPGLPWNYYWPLGRCRTCRPVPLPSFLTFVQNSTELTTNPSNGPVWHSYLCFLLLDIHYISHCNSY